MSETCNPTNCRRKTLASICQTTFPYDLFPKLCFKPHKAKFELLLAHDLGTALAVVYASTVQSTKNGSKSFPCEEMRSFTCGMLRGG